MEVRAAEPGPVILTDTATTVLQARAIPEAGHIQTMPEVAAAEPPAVVAPHLEAIQVAAVAQA